MPRDDDHSAIDFQPDDPDSSGLKVDASVHTLALVAVFSAVALPPGMPDYLKAVILDRADQERDAAGDLIIDNRMHPEGAAARQAKADGDKDDDVLSQWAQIIQQDQQQSEHERLWMEAPQTYAGQTMSGAEWRSMIDWFRDGTHVAEWEDAMMAETGQSREEVRQTGGKMKRFYDLMDKDAKGTLSKEERSDFETLRHDKEIRRGVEVQREIQGLRPNLSSELSQRNDMALDGSADQHLHARINIAEDDTPRGLASVANIKSIYQEAASGALGTAPPQPVAPVAANTVKISPNNMFG